MNDPLDTSAARNAFGDAARPTSPGDEGQGWVPHSAAEFGTDLAAAHPRYRVIEYMKHGGMGAVYRCTDSEKGGREVVVKVMRWDRMHAKDFVARFRRERDMLSKLDHPHIVPCLDMGETADGYPFFVMPYLTGVLLEHYTRDRPPLPRGQARAFCIRILQELCAALGHLHENGGIHRDVKPSNIFLVGREESVRLLDLGILRLLDPTDGIHTMLGDRPGTQRYLAPEVMANRPADERADIYSLGVIALQLLTGHYPEPGYAKPSEFGHDPRFDAIIEKALNPYPADRYESAAKFAEALEALKERSADKQSSAMQNTPTTDDEYPTPDSESIVIEFTETTLTVNGLDFSLTTTIEDWMQVLGRYSRVVPITNNVANYIWSNIGLSVTMRDRTFASINIPINNPYDGVLENHKISIESEINDILPFQGKLTLNGFEIHPKTTYSNLCRFSSRFPKDNQSSTHFNIYDAGECFSRGYSAAKKYLPNIGFYEISQEKAKPKSEEVFPAKDSEEIYWFMKGQMISRRHLDFDEEGEIIFIQFNRYQRFNWNHLHTDHPEIFELAIGERPLISLKGHVYDEEPWWNTRDCRRLEYLTLTNHRIIIKTKTEIKSFDLKNTSLHFVDYNQFPVSDETIPSFVVWISYALLLLSAAGSIVSLVAIVVFRNYSG